MAHVKAGTPAATALRNGDRILSVEGRQATPAGVVEATRRHRCAGKQVQGCLTTTPVHLTVERNGHAVPLSIYPRYNAKEKRALMGFEFGARPLPVGLWGATTGALAAMWGTLKETVSGLGRALTSEKARGEVHSVIGITQYAQESVAAGAGFGLVFLGFFSLALAILNLFPFLPLDGGHIVWSLAEKVRGKRISISAMYRYSSVGIILMLFLVINGFSNDIGHLGG